MAVARDQSAEQREEEPAVEMLTPEEAREAFDRIARRELGMSGEEFLRRWDAGEFRDDPEERPGLEEVVMLLPLVGR